MVRSPIDLELLPEVTVSMTKLDWQADEERKIRVTTAALAGFFVVGVGAAVGVASVVAAQDLRWTLALWLAGAVGLGLISGYSTGASKKTGSTGEFLKFVSAGIVVPLLGATSIVQGSKVVSESITYVQDQVATKVTDTSGVSYEAGIHPLAVLGGFFLFYGAFAATGIVIGIHHRKSDFDIEQVV